MPERARRWSVRSAARFARDARSGTVEHLRTAPIARRTQEAKLARAFSIHRAAFDGRRDKATVLLFGGMGYRPPYPTELPAAAEMVVADEGRVLAGADLYVMTPDMCDVVVAAASTLTADDLHLFDEDDLPSPTGLLVLPHPLILVRPGDNLADVRALSWHTPAFVTLPDATGSWEPTPSVRMSSYLDRHGPVRPDSFLQYVAVAREEGTPLPPLLLDAIRCIPFRPTNDPELSARTAEASREFEQAQRGHLLAAGIDEGGVVGHYVSGDHIGDADDTFGIRFLYAFWRLCDQRIADVAAVEPNHAARVAAGRAGLSPDVRLVRLRLRDGSGAVGEAHQMKWQHRWIVRMHKVRQWYPTEQRHKVIYRGPYVKGPDGKPFIKGDSVRALVR
jgi:hypothetical protein